MPFMTWKESYSVGIQEIDQQHKVLFDMVNELYDAMREGKGKDVIVNLLTELFKYTKYHFKTEEGIFTKYHYSKAEDHLKEHLELKVKVETLLEDLNSGKTSISIKVFNLLKDWISIHIFQKDMLYAKELEGKVK
ncbi:MAG: bacteriohemerythrin [Velocimicrobium sp.]